MNATTLCLLLCVVVGSYGLSIVVCSKKLGEQCGPVNLCCEGCCEEGVCKNSTKCSHPKTCEELKCQPWQECFYPLTHCEERVGCTRQPFCRPRQRIGIPKQHSTLDNPCAVVDCREGSQCKTYHADCIAPPCSPHLRVRCVPKDDHTITDVNRYKRDTYSDDPCSHVFCAGGKVCQTERVRCLVPPCPKPTAKCVPREETYRKPAVKREGATLPDDPCAAVSCIEGYECQFVAVNCFVPPCPMASGPRCLPKRVTRSRRDSVRNDPCAMVRCRGDHECKAVTVQCFVAPCPKIARCLPKKGSTTYI